ncbi:hypothetical protein [Nocardia sp. NPDC049707]|uniref:hypothetical protein n=1 Tax=Nocardia sp. NPDC049707 TaxID=3154735 RepID=UPI00342A0E5D
MSAGDVWIALGWVVAMGLPSAVLAAVILWPERILKDRTAEAIRKSGRRVRTRITLAAMYCTTRQKYDLDHNSKWLVGWNRMTLWRI